MTRKSSATHWAGFLKGPKLPVGQGRTWAALRARHLASQASRIRCLISIALGLALAGCSSSRPSGFTDVQSQVQARTGYNVQCNPMCAEQQATDGVVDGLLQHELTAEQAAQIALLKNPSLQVTFQSLGISEAAVLQAGMLKNPGISLDLRFPNGPPSATYAQVALMDDFLDVLLVGLRKKMANEQLEQTKLTVSHEVLDLIAEVKTAFYSLQGQEQLVTRLQLIEEFNLAAAELAKRQFDAGTTNELDLKSQQLLASQSRGDVIQAQGRALDGRERLHRLMGLSARPINWRISPRLPTIPEEEIAGNYVESLALAQRLDLAARRRRVAVAQYALELREKTRYFPGGINLGVSSERETDRQVRTGPSLDLQLPIFDQGQGEIARLQAELCQEQWQVDSLASDVRAQVRRAYGNLMTSRDLAKLYGSVVLPQRVELVELNLRHYNAMLKGAYDLLLAKQNEVTTERDYVEAWRDYWIARTELERAVGGPLPLQRRNQP